MTEAQWRVDRIQMGELKSLLVRRTQTEATHLVVLCHGFGAPGDDLMGCAEYFAGECEEAGIAPLFAIPQGVMDLSRYGMYGARAWWEINMAKLMELNQASSFDELRNEVPPGIDDARAKLSEGIRSIQDEYDAKDLPLILGGFSQGAMLTVDTSLRGLEKAPDGMLLYSGALICESHWKANIGKLSKTQIFQSHGTQDAILPFATGEMLRDLIRTGQSESEFLVFQGPHTIPTESMEQSVDLIKSLK